MGKIIVGKRGIDEFISHSADKRKLALVPRLKELIETSTVGQKEAPKHERKDGIVGFVPLCNEAIIDGQAVKTETLIRIDENGNLFYDVFLDEKRSRRKSNMETKSMPLSTASDINITLSEGKNNIDQSVIDELNGKIQSITGEQMELFQKESVVGKTYDAVYDEIGRWIEECFDVGVSVDEMNVLTEKTIELAAEFQSGLKSGENPSVEAMAKIKEMRETVAAMNPTNWLSLSVNSYGRAAMLSSPKSAILNILSNAETYVTEAIVRRIANSSFEKAVDPKAVRDYLKYDYDVYRASGVMMSAVRPEEILDPARRLLGENVMSSAGEGNFRKGVRFMERLIFDWSLGTPDAKAKALSFVDNAALEATKTAKAEGRFKNAIEGLGLGALTDAFVKGVKAVKAARIAKAKAKAEGLKDVEDMFVPKIDKEDLSALGDVDAGLISKKSVQEIKPIVEISSQEAKKYWKKKSEKLYETKPFLF